MRARSTTDASSRVRPPVVKAQLREEVAPHEPDVDVGDHAAEQRPSPQWPAGTSGSSPTSSASALSPSVITPCSVTKAGRSSSRSASHPPTNDAPARSDSPRRPTPAGARRSRAAPARSASPTTSTAAAEAASVSRLYSGASSTLPPIQTRIARSQMPGSRAIAAATFVSGPPHRIAERRVRSLGQARATMARAAVRRLAAGGERLGAGDDFGAGRPTTSSSACAFRAASVRGRRGVDSGQLGQPGIDRRARDQLDAHIVGQQHVRERDQPVGITGEVVVDDDPPAQPCHGVSFGLATLRQAQRPGQRPVWLSDAERR